VENFYRESHRECCLNDKGFPAARSVQQLVRRGSNGGDGASSALLLYCAHELLGD
jgi:hypothetical protein